MRRLNESTWLDRRESKRWLSKYKYNRFRFHTPSPLSTIGNFLPLIGMSAVALSMGSMITNMLGGKNGK